MKKQYGSSNKGFAKGRETQVQLKIRKRILDGESAKSSKALAQMMDNLYGTDFVNHYHQAG